jgi:di/tricarboxylate transporter
MRESLLSLALVLTVWFLHEPELLKTQLGSSAGASPRIEFAVADSLQSLQTPIKAMQEINQVTLLVLILFFIIQLVIYSFCLIKLREIEKQQLNAELKLKLLDNEDNLFDFGLYVGLGGTVLSLIMVAIGLVEASLMAAYASTLFGILFVALLKVLHLRPYRRKLIMAAESSYSVLQPSVGHPENGN